MIRCQPDPSGVQRAALREMTLPSAASAEFLKLENLFRSLPNPCGLDGAVRFNLLFSHLYPQLSPAERRRAEAFVDALMANLEPPVREEADVREARHQHR